VFREELSPIDPSTHQPLWAEPTFGDTHWETVDLTPPPAPSISPWAISGYVPGWTTTRTAQLQYDFARYPQSPGCRRLGPLTNFRPQNRGRALRYGVGEELAVTRSKPLLPKCFELR